MLPDTPKVAPNKLCEAIHPPLQVDTCNQLSVGGASYGFFKVNTVYLADLPQVPLLLRLGEDMRALARATESGDTDLVYLVLFSMYRSLPLQNFIAAINARPSTRNLFLAYCSRTVCHLLQGLDCRQLMQKVID